MGTVSDLIKSALRDIGAIATGETPSASELTDGLTSLNDLVETWSADGFLVFEEKIETFTLIANQQQYGIGSGGDFDTVRPIQIKGAGIKQSGGEDEQPVKILNIQEWQSIVVKSTSSELPLYLYYNPAYPLGEVNVWPKPSAASSLVLYSEKPLTAFANTAATVSLPPGYQRALRKNLALELAPEYGRNPSPLLMEQAMESKAEIMRRNMKTVLLGSDTVNLNRNRPFNIITGE